MVFNILEGRYYVIYHLPAFNRTFYCPECYWNPQEDHVPCEVEVSCDQSLLPEQQARELEQAQIKVRARKRVEEVARREQEAKEEALRQEALHEEEEKRIEARRQLKDVVITKGKRQQIEYQFSVKSDLSRRFLAFTNEVKVHEAVHYCNPFKRPNPSLQKSADNYNEALSLDSDILSGVEEMDEVTLVSTEMADTVSTMISDMQPDQELDGEWLRAVQTFLLTYYSQKNTLSHLEIDILMDFLAYVQSGLRNEESLYLAKTLCSIGDIHPSHHYFDENLSLPCKFSSLLLYNGNLHHENSHWMQKCLNFSVSAMIKDEQLQKMVTDAVCGFWSAYDWFCFVQKCDATNISPSTQKHILHLVQTYSIKPDIADEALQSTSAIQFLNDQVKNEHDKQLSDILYEIKQTSLVDESTLDQVEQVVTAIHELLEERNFHIDLDYNTHLGSKANIAATEKIAH